MKRLLLIALTSFMFSNYANAYYWTEAVPSQVILVDGGLVVRGAFDTTTSACATGVGILLKNDETDVKAFDRKLSLAMMAFASGKTLKVLINDPVDTNCEVVSAHGALPVVYHNYWIVK